MASIDICSICESIPIGIDNLASSFHSTSIESDTYHNDEDSPDAQEESISEFLVTSSVPPDKVINATRGILATSLNEGYKE